MDQNYEKKEETVHAEVQETKPLQTVSEKQLMFSKITCGAVLVMALVIIMSAAILVPRTLRSLEEVDTMSAELEMVTRQIAKVNLPEKIENFDRMIKSSDEGMKSLSNSLAELDIEQFNTAIENLSKAIAPLAQLFGR